MTTLKFSFLIAPFLIIASLCFLFRKMLNKTTYFCLFFLFWWSFSLKISDSPIFYYKTVTLGFSETFMGIIQTIANAGGALGALLFFKTSRKKLYWKNYLIAETSLVNMLRWTGFIGIILILTGFLLMGAKSAIMLAFGSGFIYLFANLSILVLAAEFCPAQIEGTFFALLMSVINLGTSMANRVSGALFNLLISVAPQNLADNFWAKFLVWLGWPIKHTLPQEAKCDVFVQYYAIGWLIIIALCAYATYFIALKYVGNSIKEKGQLKTLDISIVCNRKKP